LIGGGLRAGSPMRFANLPSHKFNRVAAMVVAGLRLPRAVTNPWGLAGAAGKQALMFAEATAGHRQPAT